MKSIILKPGYSCNNQCVFCKAGKVKIDLDFEEIKKRIKKIKETKVFERILLSGGEVTTRHDFFEIIDEIISHKLKWGVATNLRKFSDPKFIKKIIEKKPDLIFGSFYSNRKRISETITQKKSFNENVKGLENVLKSKINFIVNVVISKINIKTITETIEFLKNKGVKTICLSLVQPIEKKQDYSIELNEAREIFSKIVPKYQKKEFIILLDYYSYKNFQDSLSYLGITHAFEPFEEKIRIVKE